MWISSATYSLSFAKFSAAVLHILVYFWEQGNVYAVVNGNPHHFNLEIPTTRIEEQTFKL